MLTVPPAAPLDAFILRGQQLIRVRQLIIQIDQLLHSAHELAAASGAPSRTLAKIIGNSHGAVHELAGLLSTDPAIRLHLALHPEPAVDWRILTAAPLVTVELLMAAQSPPIAANSPANAINSPQPLVTRPCRWWWQRLFCRAPRRPLYHSSQCQRCARIFAD